MVMPSWPRVGARLSSSLSGRLVLVVVGCWLTVQCWMLGVLDVTILSKDVQGSCDRSLRFRYRQLPDKSDIAEEAVGQLVEFLTSPSSGVCRRVLRLGGRASTSASERRRSRVLPPSVRIYDRKQMRSLRRKQWAKLRGVTSAATWSGRRSGWTSSRSNIAGEDDEGGHVWTEEDRLVCADPGLGLLRSDCVWYVSSVQPLVSLQLAAERLACQVHAFGAPTETSRQNSSQVHVYGHTLSGNLSSVVRSRLESVSADLGHAGRPLQYLLLGRGTDVWTVLRQQLQLGSYSTLAVSVQQLAVEFRQESVSEEETVAEVYQIFLGLQRLGFMLFASNANSRLSRRAQLAEATISRLPTSLIAYFIKDPCWNRY